MVSHLENIQKALMLMAHSIVWDYAKKTVEKTDLSCLLQILLYLEIIFLLQ